MKVKPPIRSRASSWDRPREIQFFLVTGYSAGGVTAIYFARAVNQRKDATLDYLGLAHAAFYDPESTGLMKPPRFTGKYLKITPPRCLKWVVTVQSGLPQAFLCSVERRFFAPA
jgi:hypothetical protein